MRPPAAATPRPLLLYTLTRFPSLRYEGGINRTAFLPFIDLLQRECAVVHMAGGVDYRSACAGDAGAERYRCDAAGRGAAMNDVAAALAGGAGNLLAGGDGALHAADGRAVGGVLSAHAADRQSVCRAAFADLCGGALGAPDYIAIAQTYDALVLDEVPVLSSSAHQEARRFIVLVDVLYDHGVRLYLSAAAPLDEVFLPHGTDRDNGDGDEAGIMGMQGDMTVSGEGGSSGRSTTMIGEAEWSATGRTGASLAGLSGVKDVGFAWARTRSRVKHMIGGGAYDATRETALRRNAGSKEVAGGAVQELTARRRAEDLERRGAADAAKARRAREAAKLRPVQVSAVELRVKAMRASK